MLASRSIALQGLGFSARSVALQGLIPVASQHEEPVISGPDDFSRTKRKQQIDRQNKAVLAFVMATLTQGIIQ